ncbi:HK97 family phage prohead protease [uncultured Dysosmobacter sp.]|uniref:HK97 family phage prohead protease n=1 Tax=uncultured Dysosmobacter sp. TaxID=2591384 RepID=UPI00261D9A3C|nr:HK97 family phage prohead protease [uncultured Dysosmobacter sp.]
MRVEIRADRKSIAVSGYVNVVGRDSRVLHDKQGPYVEQIMPGAFAKALASGSPVELRWNHQKTLGSTKNKDELELREDNIGLRANAVVSDADVISAADRSELRGWSFGFVKRKDHWKTDEDGTRHRFVDEMELREVSLLDKTPAYIATSVETRDDGDILVEYRVDEPLEEGVDYIRQTERTTEDKTTTLTPEDESVMFCASKTIEIYKMKRRM